MVAPAPEQVLHFVCAQCNAELSVPAHLAGIQGPCPVCFYQISAPRPVPVPPARESVEAWRRRVVAGLAEAAPGSPTPATGCPDFRHSSPPLTNNEPPGYALRCPSRAERRQRLQQDAEQRRRTYGIFIAVGSAVLTVILLSVLWARQLERDPGRGPRQNAGARTAPGKTSVARGKAVNAALDTMVEQKKENERQQAVLLGAQQAVLGFLQARDWAEAKTFLQPPAMHSNSQPRWFVPERWAGVGKKPLQLSQSRRTPEGGFFSIWKAAAPNQRSMTFLVDATAVGQRLRCDALAQQLEGRLALFSREPGTSRGQFYVRLARSKTRPGDGALVVEVSSPFEGADECAFTAAIEVEGGKAEHWRKLLNISSPRETTARLAWRTSGAGNLAVAIEPLGAGPWDVPSSSVAAVR